MIAKLTHKVAVAAVIVALNLAAVLAVGAVFSNQDMSSPAIATDLEVNPDGFPTWAG